MSSTNNNNDDHENGTLLLDRFMSASTVSDAIDSLEALTRLDSKIISDLFLVVEDHNNVNNDNHDESPLSSKSPMDMILQILTDGTLPNFQNQSLIDQGGQTLACQLISKLLLKSGQRRLFQTLAQDKIEWLIQALLDVATASSSSSSSSTYTRVLALELLETLCTSSPQKMQQLLLQVPNGLHDLSELLMVQDDNDDSVVVRNQALLLMKQIAKVSSSCSKIFIFEDVPTHCMNIIRQEGNMNSTKSGGSSSSSSGLTKGTMIVQDCLTLLQTLIQHDPESSSDLILETPTVVQQLVPLLDLRQGIEYIDPTLIGKSTTPNSTVKEEEKEDLESKVKSTPSNDNSDDDDDDDDDLDNILKSASSSSKKPTKQSDSTTAAAAAANDTSSSKQQQLFPKLIPPEERVVEIVFSILELLTSTPAHQQLVITKYPPIPALLWELALVSPPPPTASPPCAMPSFALQQKALQLVGTHFNSPTVMNHHNGLDRLLYLICTGSGGASANNTTTKPSMKLQQQQFQQKMALSQSAIHVVRQTISSERAHEIVLHTLAPPLVDVDTDNADGSTPTTLASPPPTTEVQKLINTLTENLPLPEDTDNNDGGGTSSSSSSSIGPLGMELRNQRCLNLVGALSALGIFLCPNDNMEDNDDDMNREMMLNIIPMDMLLMDLEHQRPLIQYAILKLLCDWISPSSSKDINNKNDKDKDTTKKKEASVPSNNNVTQRIIQLVLSSTYSTSLGVVFHNNKSSTSNSSNVSAMAGLLLGLCMDGIAVAKKDDTSTSNQDSSSAAVQDEMYGGWSKQGILDMITSTKYANGRKGISGYTATLESLKRNNNTQQQDDQIIMMPWSACHLENERFQVWTKRMVHVVRKRVVHEMSGSHQDGNASSSEEEDDSDTQGVYHDKNGSDNTTKTKKEYKSLRRLVSQQSMELEELRESIQNHEGTRLALEKQLTLWKRRAEANPTQLDEILSESTSQNEQYQVQIQQLEKQLKEKDDRHDEAIQEYQKQITNLETKVTSSQEEQRQAQEEYTTIRSEMEALSTAYTNLEVQYNNAMTATGQQQHQSQGEPTSSSDGGGGGGQQEITTTSSSSNNNNNMEMETLRTENARLRQEAVAADEWMTMAVQRMNDMAGQTATLQQEVTTLKQQQQQYAPLGMDQSTTNVGGVATDIATTTAAASHQEELQVERQQRQQLETELSNVKENAKITLESLTQSNLEKEDLTQELAGIQKELETAQAQVVTLRDAQATTTSLEAESSLSQSLSTKEHEIVTLKQEMEMLRQTNQNGKEELKSLKESVKSLHHDLDEARKQVEDTMKRAGEEKQSHDTAMLELERQLAQVKDSGASTSTSTSTSAPGAATADAEAIRARDEEIKSLTAANDAAQEWMAKAVEHHQMLSEQLAALENDKSSLVKQIEDLQQKNAAAAMASEGSNNDMKQLKDQAAKNMMERHQIQDRLTTVQLEFEAQQEELKRMKELSGEEKDKTESLISQVKQLEENCSEHVRERNHFREKLETVQLEFQAQQDELRLKREKAEESRKSLAEEVNRLKSELLNKEGDLQRYRDQINATQQSQEDSSTWMQEELSRANTEISQLREELQAAHASAYLLQDKQAEFDETQQNLMTEISTMRSQLEFKTAQATQLESEKGQLETQNNEHVIEIENIQVAYKNLEARSKAMEQNEKVLEKQVEDLREQMGSKDDVETQLKDKDDALMQMEESLRQKDQEMEEIQTQSEEVVRQWQDRATELETTIKEVESELEQQKVEADNVIAQWEQRYNEVESTYQVGFTEQLDELNNKLRDKEAALATAEEAARKEREQIEQKSADVVQQWTERAGELERSVKELEADLEQSKKDATDVISQWQSQYDEVVEEKMLLENDGKDMGEALVAAEEALSMSQKELDEVQKESENVVQQWTEKVEELQATIKELEEDLEKQQQDASDIISQWETRYSEATENQSSLEAELKKREEALEQDEQALTIAQKEFEELKTESEKVVGQWKDRADELESTVKDLEKDLDEQAEEAQEAISKWETRCSTLDERIAKLDSEVDEGVKERDDLSKKLEESSTKLKSATELVESLKTEIKIKEEKEAALQTDLDTKAQEIGALELQFATENESLTITQKSLEADLEGEKELVASCKKEIESLKEELTEMQEQSEQVVSQWKVRCDELEEAVNDLEDELENQQDEATEAISKWESRCSSLEEKSMQLENDAKDSTTSNMKRIKKLESDLKAEISTKEEAQSKLTTEIEKATGLEELVATLMAERSKGEAELSTELESIRSRKVELEQKLESETRLLNTRETELSVERESHELDKVSFEREKMEMKALVSQLQEELIEANSTLQSCVTDEVTQKATETAMEALRVELDGMRSKMEVDRRAFQEEHRARLSAEEEAEQLKSDLSVLLPTISRADSKKFTFKAAEKVQSMERKEIEELRKALEKALQEVASARATEKEVAERAASSRLQASVCEQEVIAAKADVKFLTETMEEMREAEATRRATLEYRISALEDDRAVLTRFHADELESLRNELEHLMVEKDRLLMSLREAERANVSLKSLMAKEKKSGGEHSASEELARLRLEKAQLLASAEEDASKVERRIKEAVATEVASLENDATTEREMRLAAEANAADLKEELEEYHERMAESAGASSDRSSSDSVTLEKLRKESKKLKEDNSSLQNRLVEMEAVSTQAKASISELTEKYRKCQAKLHKVEREGLFDAEVTAEIARLRANAARQSPRSKKENQNDSWLVVSTNPAEDDNEDDIATTTATSTPRKENMTATEAYDYILKQKDAIKEERSMYNDLLAEHDDLLALLAQQDLEKASLLAALEDAAGENAVDEAIYKAQQTAVKEFGKYVKLNQVEKID